MNINYSYFVDTINTSEIKRIKAKIISASEDNKSAVIETLDQETRLELYNKSGELLSVGDYVTVEYSDLLSSKTAYIYMRNGIPQYMIQEGGGNAEFTDSIVGYASSVYPGVYESIKSIVLPDNVTTIGERAFINCTNLESITIPEGVTSIGKEAFENCEKLMNVVLPDSIKTIEDQAFYQCFKLEGIAIPEGVTSIGNSTFANCWSMKNINIPNSVTSVGYNAFSSCNGITSMIIPNSIMNISDGMFGSCNCLTDIVIPDNITSIGEYAFALCPLLAHIYYIGTEEQWNAIPKGSMWNYDMGSDVSGGTQIHYNYVP